MIVEFTGIPGAGKSTAAGVFAEELGQLGQRVVCRDEVLRRYVRAHYCRHYSHDFSLRRPVTLLYRMGLWARHLEERVVRRCPAGLHRPEARLAGLWLTEDRVLEEHFLQGTERDEVLVLSEGLVHHLAAGLVWIGDSAMQLAAGAPHLTSGCLQVVHVRAPVKVAGVRLQRRGRPETWPPGIDDLDSLLHSFERGIRDALAWLRALPVRVHDLDMSCERSLADDRVRALARTIAADRQH